MGAERGRINWDDLVGRGVGLAEDEPVALSVVTAAELLHGVHRLKGVGRVRAERYVDALLQQLPVHPFDAPSSLVIGGPPPAFEGARSGEENHLFR